MRKEGGCGALTVVVCNDPERRFGGGEVSFVPERFTGVRVASKHMTVLQENPGVMAQHSIHAEKLNLTQLSAELREKMITEIGVIRWIWQIGPHDEGPSAHRWGDEQSVLQCGVHSLLPGAGSRIA